MDAIFVLLGAFDYFSPYVAAFDGYSFCAFWGIGLLLTVHFQIRKQVIHDLYLLTNGFIAYYYIHELV